MARDVTLPLSQRRWRLAATFAMAVALPLNGCVNSTYMGIPLAQGGADPELQQLAQRARSGDKQAQLKLGIAFEEGRGIPRDSGKAKWLYRHAASDSGDAVWTYIPSVGNGTQGRVIPLRKGTRRAGLVEAKVRLAALASN